MDFRRLEAFSKVYELRSFSKAGQELYLSQPTISAHVSSLESELGVRLFDRLGRNILPTQAAEVLVRHARDIFASVKSAEMEIKLLQDRVSGNLTIGGSTIPAHYLLPELLAGYRAQYDEVELHLRVGDSMSIIEMIASGEDMVGIVGTRDENPDLAYDSICEDELVVVAAPSFGGTSNVPMSIESLAAMPFVMREAGSGTRISFERTVAAHLNPPRPLRTVLTVDSTMAALQSVRAGIGVTVTSRLAAKAMLESGELMELPVEGISMRRSFYLVYHARRHQFPAASLFIDHVRSACAS